MSDVPRSSQVWNDTTIDDIQSKAELGRYRIRGFSQLRERPLPHDLHCAAKTGTERSDEIHRASADRVLDGGERSRKAIRHARNVDVEPGVDAAQELGYGRKRAGSAIRR